MFSLWNFLQLRRFSCVVGERKQKHKNKCFFSLFLLFNSWQRYWAVLDCERSSYAVIVPPTQRYDFTSPNDWMHLIHLSHSLATALFMSSMTIPLPLIRLPQKSKDSSWRRRSLSCSPPGKWRHGHRHARYRWGRDHDRGPGILIAISVAHITHVIWIS
jgi:hypothetical protein